MTSFLKILAFIILVPIVLAAVVLVAWITLCLGYIGFLTAIFWMLEAVH